MSPVSITMMFEQIGLSYGLMLPVIILVLFTLVCLPAVFRPSSRAEAIGKAAYCYLAQMLGVLLMTAGGLPALYAVCTGNPLTEITYVGLLMIFAIGGLIFLWHDAVLHTIDAPSRAIPGTIFFITWKFIGLLVTAFAALSFVLKLILADTREPNWWTVQLIMLAYGLTVSWFVLYPPSKAAAPAPKASPTPKKKPAKKKK